MDAPVLQPRRILLCMEDDGLGDLLDETLSEAGHLTSRIRDDEELATAAAFDSIVIDLDLRIHESRALLARLRLAFPASTIVALLPCGADPATPALGWDVALEKPARLRALLAAVRSCRKP